MASNYIIQLQASGVQAGPHSYLGPFTERLSVPDPQELPSWYKFSSPATGRKAIAFCPSKTAAEMIAAGMNRSIVRA